MAVLLVTSLISELLLFNGINRSQVCLTLMGCSWFSCHRRGKATEVDGGTDTLSNFLKIEG